MMINFRFKFRSGSSKLFWLTQTGLSIVENKILKNHYVLCVSGSPTRGYDRNYEKRSYGFMPKLKSQKRYMLKLSDFHYST